jgi:hypothetical protein
MISLADRLGAGLAAIAFAAAIVAPLASLGAEWTVAPAPTEDEPFDAAQITSEAGDILLVWSRPTADGIQVFAELHPADGVAFAHVMPVYRVDADEPVDTDVIRFKGEEKSALWGMVNDRVTFWLLWQSTEAIARPGDPLNSWIRGRELVVSIPVADGSTRIIRFSLAGSSVAIRKATGVAVQ